MSGNRNRVRIPAGNVVRGLLRIARGDAEGIREFRNTPDAFYASIAPLLAFPLVGCVLFGIQGHWLLAGAMLLSRLSSVLLQPVLTEFYAARSESSVTWLMTSTALNWSLWLIFPLIPIGALIANGLVTIGLGEHRSIVYAIGMIGLYFLWFQWFIVKAGLRLNGLRALILVIVLNLTITFLCIEPYLAHPTLLNLTLNPGVK